MRGERRANGISERGISERDPAQVGAAHQGSLWLDQAEPPARRAPLAQDTTVDVAVVGGGFSGLWTAWYLAQLDPTLKIVVIESRYCGFGASGRNGGWCIGELAGSIERYAKHSSLSDSLRLVRAMFDTVDEVGRVIGSRNIDCGWSRGGTIRVARNEPQAQRQRDEVAHMHELGFADQIQLLSATEARVELNATKVRSGIAFAPSAALDPARLVQGLAADLESRGVTIFEDTTVTEIGDRSVSTAGGMVRADVVVRATEAYTSQLPGQKRTLLPVYSLMIATEPLPASAFDEIGLARRQTFADDRMMVIYGQRTPDDRLAFGGRGVPYLLGSRIDPQTELHLKSHRGLRDTLVDLLPAVADARITHRWGGVLAMPRNWLPSVRFNPITGVGSLGGYVGEGVAAANLAGRTLAELILRHDTERTSLPWVGVESRRWEPEPLRWVGVRASRSLLHRADQIEETTDRPARTAQRVAAFLRGE